VGPEDVFIDVGSGMGRAVFLAARNYRFKRVIGVELSEVLNGVARANIDRNRERLRCPDIELFTTDVLDYEVPDDVTVAFFNNPFVGAVFTVAIDKLLASVDRRSRRVRLIYCNPVEHDQLMTRGRFRPVRKLPGLRPGREWSRSNATRMYDVLPRPAVTREARRSPYNTG
jgi:SAM-dependent methyltransferase